MTIKTRWLKLLGYVVRSDPDEDHVRAFNASVDEPPKDWRWPRDRPRQTWLRTVEHGYPATKHRAVGGQTLCTRLSFLASNDRDGYAPAGACPMMMMMMPPLYDDSTTFLWGKMAEP